MAFMCEAKTDDFPRRLQPGGKLCTHKAKVELDGKKLCIKHAGRVAVRIAILNGTAKRLPVEEDDIW